MESLSFRCPSCATTKPATEFHKNKSRKRGYCSECKQCVLARSKRSYDANPEKHHQRRKDWYAADPEKGRRLVKEYRERNPEAAKASVKKYKDANKDSIRVAERAWIENNREKVRGYNRHKRALMRSIPSERYSTEDILTKWGTDCHICKEPIDLNAPRRGSRLGLQLDHVIPLSKGGHDTIANVKPAHAFCNISKKDKIIPSAQ